MQNLNHLSKTTPEQLETIVLVAKKLSQKYTFGYYDKSDIEQEAIIIGLSKLSKYNESCGGLQTFMYTVIGNALKNFKRNKYHRLISKKCSEPNCDGDKRNCASCFSRANYVAAKKNIMSPYDIEHAKSVEDSCHANSQLENLEMTETLSIIDEKLPIEMRTDYLKMREAIKIPKSRRLAIEAKIMEILENYYGDI